MLDLLGPVLAFFVAGICGGVLLGLIGVGMALVTVPLLIFSLPLFGFDSEAVPLIALATSMAVVSVGSVSSVLSHNRKGNVIWQVARTTIPVSLIGIAIGSSLAARLPGGVIRVLFCAFLIYIAIRMLRGRKPGGAAASSQTGPWHYRLVGGAIGLAASVIGAGGGVFMVPFLSSRGHPMPKAVATSTLIGLPVSILGAVVYALQPVDLPGNLAIGYLYVPAFVGLAAGSALGAPLGVRISGQLDEALIKKVFAGALLCVAAAILLEM
ncbi:sulfite exporter TauE/SafE family protein [Celeribacter baekdonensis]|uniref:Probable membrane transporter protein n=1 Tax=Celeribacter baekdonensis TaxID=875171 RepID=A0A2R4M1R9_9RHOB|nr:sulfite exporter TauE/SafE family protein [Celeribacter baekdonensis]AVW91078.1 sulfite exporter TauE/SafE family protein [Celeribacter baekdonensis]